MTRYYSAMGCYATFALMGALMVADSRVRYCLWIFLAGLAIKTSIARFRPHE